jgi:HEAT repeat protein
VRDAAAEALCRIGAPAACALVEALSHMDSFVRRTAETGLLACRGAAVRPLADALCRNGDGLLRAAQILGWIGTEAVDSLMSALDSPDADVRRAAAEALSVVGPEARAAASTLRRLAETDPNDAVQEAASQALESVLSAE